VASVDDDVSCRFDHSHNPRIAIGNLSGRIAANNKRLLMCFEVNNILGLLRCRPLWRFS
jgi:hypothetical protein